MRRVAALIVFVVLGVGLPLAGAHIDGRPLAPYLRLAQEPPFPAAASFSWPAFLIYALLIAAVVAPAVVRIVRVKPGVSGARAHSFPRWGWAGVALVVVVWAVAWSRLPALAGVQPYTFTPLWLGYILTVNALTYRRTGGCLLRDRPGAFFALFPASAAFWWYFEYVNRYVGNRHYDGIGPVSSFEYFVHASVAFSTVLPAVASTRDWLASFPRLQAAFAGVAALPAAGARPVAGAALGLAALGFLALGAWPYACFPLAWVAPMLALVSLQALVKGRSLFAEIGRGDWRGVALPALAALVAGWFWEMWNWRSLARWEYSIPLVHGFPLFEMPLLGYAGYLPFGVSCVAAAGLVCGEKRRPAPGR